MDLETLKKKLVDNKIPERWYSLDSGLKLDASNLYKNYSSMEYFYLDERGERRDFRTFKNEEDAYDYFWSKIEFQHKFFMHQSKKTD